MSGFISVFAPNASCVVKGGTAPLILRAPGAWGHRQARVCLICCSSGVAPDLCAH